MTHQTGLAASWWAEPPQARVSRLADTEPELLELASDPLPPDAPAIIFYRPPGGGSVTDQVGRLLDELDRAAVALFPHWLPGAERLDGSSALSRAAARALAAQSPGFGPFVAELAERSMCGSRRPSRSRFAAEVRAAGLGRVVRDAYRRAALVVIVTVPAGLSAGDEHALATAAEWLTHHGRLTVWLVGAPLRSVDRIRTVSISLPGHLTDLARDAPRWTPPARPPLGFPPVSGLPRADSPAEQALERGLAPHGWAHGRRWNSTFEWHTLSRVYRLDLFWPDDRLVVEVDGPEHRGRFLYADDRHRDAQLQVLGYDVLRFTNEQVLSDVQATVVTIRNLLQKRRGKL